ncbi:alpha/beta fold hydrolase [Sphingomonas fuzhouensis]|uniref:alpha/beta fold hydrolase n=1 Tax=Sphingomonas fuzhouensis TaxID=3106033 RepID=UPI002AFE5E10|nr:alpha/beta fold hydrolase [Sphingomonas sp. SGZ-02]
MPFTGRGDDRLYWQQSGHDHRPALLLIHPQSLDLTIWDRLVPFLIDHFRVIRPDLPGHGASPPPPGGLSIARAAAGAWSVLDEAGVERAMLCGVSGGGMIVAEMARIRPTAVTGLILAAQDIEPGAPFPLPKPSPSSEAGKWLAPLLRVQARTGAHGLAEQDDNRAFDGPHPVLLINPDDGRAARYAGTSIATMPDAHLACILQPGAFATAIGRFQDRVQNHGAAPDPARNGERIRREVLGDAWVDQSIAARTAWIADYQDYATEVAWHRIWGRLGLDYRTRRLLVLALTASLGRWEEFRLHVRSGLERGSLTPQDVKDASLHAGLYAGVPVANTAFAECRTIFDAMGIDPSEC